MKVICDLRSEFPVNFRPFCRSAFSPYFCPVLQCNNVAYFARSFALIW